MICTAIIGFLGLILKLWLSLRKSPEKRIGELEVENKANEEFIKNVEKADAVRRDDVDWLPTDADPANRANKRRK